MSIDLIAKISATFFMIFITCIFTMVKTMVLFDLQNGLGDVNHFLQVPPLLPKSRGDEPHSTYKERTNNVTDAEPEPEAQIRVSTISGEFLFLFRFNLPTVITTPKSTVLYKKHNFFHILTTVAEFCNLEYYSVFP